MNKALLVCCALIVGLAPVSAVRAQDLTGEWTVTADIFVPQEAPTAGAGDPDCVYDGLADLVQAGSVATGEVLLDLQTGDPQLCPGALSGDLTAEVGDGIAGVITTMMQESLDFNGQFVERPSQFDVIAGNLNVTQGPFQGAFGNFDALLNTPAPTLPRAPLAILALLLITGALWALRRRRAA